MSDQPITIAEEVTAALVVGLLRKGVIDEADIAEIGGGLSDEAAHLLNSLVVEAVAPPESDWRAEMARKRFVVVKNAGEAG